MSRCLLSFESKSIHSIFSGFDNHVIIIPFQTRRIDSIPVPFQFTLFTSNHCFAMPSVSELYNTIQIQLLNSQKELDKLDKPETTLEELRLYEENLRKLFAQLKEITAKVKADRSDQKMAWQR